MVVVGAGFGGLSAALHLAGAGRRVTLLEATGAPGGCAGTALLGSRRVDTGPTVITMPDVLEAALAAVGERLADRVELLALDPVYRACFADGTSLDVSTDIDRTADAIAALAGTREAAGYRRLVRWLGRVYAAERDTFIDRNIDGVGDLLRPDLARLVALGGLGSVAGAVGRHLHDERLRRVFTFQSLYAGVSPWAARALYAVIAYLDTVAGAVYPRGGVHAIPLALAAAATAHGVELRYGAPVVGVDQRGGRIVGVRTAAGDRVAADAVVFAMDAPTVYSRLLGRPLRRRVRTSPSAVLLQLATRRSWPRLAHHTVSFGAAWRETFDELTRTGTPMGDPSLLITTPAVTDPDPVGAAVLSVLAPTPNLRTGQIDWDRIGPRYRDELVATLQARGLDGLDTEIEAERLVTPADWAAAGHTDGTPFAAAHTVGQTGPFRLANLVPGLDNAVLAGGWTVPGVGVPMAVISGRLAAARIAG